MLSDDPVWYFAIAAAICIVMAFARRKMRRIEPENARWIGDAQLLLVLFGGFLVCNFLRLPSTPSLATFGYPQTSIDVDNPEKVVRYLQTYNRELVRTVEILENVLLFGVFGLVSGMVGILQSVKKNQFKAPSESFARPAR